VSRTAPFGYIFGVISIVGLLLIEYFGKEKLLYESYGVRKEMAISGVMILLLILFGVFYNVSFIYFQF
jgi:hypothetical protein